ncbi:hypothetical protein IAS59_002433 [Cryptococcus gattii]
MRTLSKARPAHTEGRQKSYYFTDNDPTGGTVNYMSKSEGQSSGLLLGEAGTVLGLKAKINLQTSGVYILDLNHMPVGCGTWPAFWTVVKSDWPVGGEIDFLEGANGLLTKYSLHGTPPPALRPMQTE